MVAAHFSPGILVPLPCLSSAGVGPFPANAECNARTSSTLPLLVNRFDTGRKTKSDYSCLFSNRSVLQLRILRPVTDAVFLYLPPLESAKPPRVRKLKYKRTRLTNSQSVYAGRNLITVFSPTNADQARFHTCMSSVEEVYGEVHRHHLPFRT